MPQLEIWKVLHQSHIPERKFSFIEVSPVWSTLNPRQNECRIQKRRVTQESDACKETSFLCCEEPHKLPCTRGFFIFRRTDISGKSSSRIIFSFGNFYRKHFCRKQEWTNSFWRKYFYRKHYCTRRNYPWNHCLWECFRGRSCCDCRQL